MKMPFGKFEGRHCHEVPRHYLQWALETLGANGDPKTAMEKGLQRIDWNPPPARNIDKLLDEISYVWGD